MKRHIIRITALAGVLTIAWIAIAQTQVEKSEDADIAPPPASQSSAVRRLPPPTVPKVQVTQNPQNAPPLLVASGDYRNNSHNDRTGGSPSANPLRFPNGSAANENESSVQIVPPQVQQVQQAQESALPAAQSPAVDDPNLSDPFGVRQHAGEANTAAAAPNEIPAPTMMAATTQTQPVREVTAVAATIAEDTPRPFPSNQMAAPLNAADGTDRYAISAPEAPLDEGTGLPARDRSLDGAQTPQMTVEKTAPPEIQVGNPASFRIVARNTGTATAINVEIRDRVPKGARLIETGPRAAQNAAGELVWKLGDMKPGDERAVEMKLMPLAEGEIGSVASVRFDTGVSARSVAVKPQLVIEAVASDSVHIGEEMTISINVSNPGSGIARGVVITEQVPPGLQHPAGAELEYEIGDLKPNETRKLDLKLAAAQPGRAVNVLLARGEGGLQSKHELPLDILAPSLKLAISGPKLRFLERETTYKLSVSNPGTAPARDVRLQAKLPEGMRFVSTNNNGYYDPQTNTVSWALAELPVNETGAVMLTAMPEELGETRLTYRGEAAGALSVEEQKEILVDGIAALRFEVVDVEDPVVKGGETTYEIRVLNQGTKAADNVRVQVALPPGLQLIDAEGPSGNRPAAGGNIVSFSPLNRLSPKADATYRVRVKCAEAGDQRISVQLLSAEMQSPLTKEESTRVFTDN